MTNSFAILNSRVPAGGFGRHLTSAEARALRQHGLRRISQGCIVVQNRADHLGIVYRPVQGQGRRYAHTGITVALKR